MNRFETGFGDWVIRHRWWIIIGTILIVFMAGAGGRHITFTNDSRIYFSKENPHLQALEALENTYTKDDNVLIVLAPTDGNVFTRRTLAAVQELTDVCWKVPYSSRVDSLTNFQHTLGEADELIVEDLVQDAEVLSSNNLKQIKEIAVSEPLLVNRLISSSGHVTAVNVNIIKPDKSDQVSPEVAGYVRKMVNDFRKKHSDIDFYLTGGIMIDTAFGEASQMDMNTLMPAMFLVLIIIMGFSMRSVTGTLTTLAIIAISVITAMGLAGWLNISLTPASANSPTIILTLAVADSIHILITIFHQMREGKSKYAAIKESLRVNLQPVFLTSLTTTIGFLTMNFSDAPPFRDLGNIVAIGVTAAFIFSILFLPALIAVLPVKVKAMDRGSSRFSFSNLADFVISRQRLLFWGTLFFAAVVSLGLMRIELNDDFIKYFDDRYEFRRATDFVQENLTGLNRIEYSLKAGETGGIYDPNFLATAENFAVWYRKQPGVVHVNSITDIMKRLNKNMHQDDAAYYRIPGQRDLAAQYLLLYEMSLPFGLDLNNQIDVAKSAVRMTVTLGDVTSREMRDLDELARGWLRANAPPGMFTYGTGLSVMFAHISERNIKSMLSASFGALVLISAILIFALRSLKIGLISLIPNLAPAFMSFGMWGIIVGQVGLAVSVLVALTLGIVVDDTVHFMSKYLRARREHGMTSQEAIRYAFSTVGTALWVTTATLVAGFTVLSFSGFKINSDMGLMTAITITFALTLDFLFLPVLLMKTEEKKDETADSDYDANFVPVPVRGDSRNS